MSTILPQMVHGLSEILECRSETCCAWLTENTARQKIAKKSPSAHHPTTLSGYIFATKACIDNRKKKLLISTGFASWQRYCTVFQYWASAKLCGIEQRAPPIFGRATIRLGIGPHSSRLCCRDNTGNPNFVSQSSCDTCLIAYNLAAFLSYDAEPFLVNLSFCRFVDAFLKKVILLYFLHFYCCILLVCVLALMFG